MYAITYAIELLEPLLATQPFSGEANSAVTYPYIPGSMIRGACIRACQNGRSGDLSHDGESRALFFSDDVCFLHAYPAHPRREERLLPRPRSWFVEKDKADDEYAAVYDFARADNDVLERPKSPGGLFCAIEEDDVLLLSPQIQMQIHNASENRNRKQAGSSQVYRYEALDAGSVFCFNAADVDVNRLESLVKTGIGERRNEGYGRIAVNWHTRNRYGQIPADPPKPTSVTLRGSVGEEIARRMATRRLRADLERGLLRDLHPDKVIFRRLPSATQLAQVRVAARRAQAQNDLSVIANHLKNLKGAKAEWQQARYLNESLYGWVIKQTEMTAETFQNKFLPGSLPQLADIKAEITPELQTEFIARLIDGVMKLAVETARAEKEGAAHG